MLVKNKKKFSDIDKYSNQLRKGTLKNNSNKQETNEYIEQLQWPKHHNKMKLITFGETINDKAVLEKQSENC